MAMKALFHRFRGGSSKDKDKESAKERDPDQTPKEKSLQLPPLTEWPPPQRASLTPSSISSFKPLPELSVRPLPPIEEPAISTTSEPIPSSSTSRQNSHEYRTNDSAVDLPNVVSHYGQEINSRSSQKTAVGSINTVTTTTTSDVHKKVAFISPPPTPATFDRNLPEVNGSAAPAPMKTTLSRFQATHGKEPRALTPAVSTPTPKTDIGSSSKASVKATSTRTATSPYSQYSKGNNGDGASITQTMRSGTPYSQNSHASSSRILAAASWSEGAEEDLVSNLGSRERTRQEVLFEILASEERYVQELLKMRDTFIDPLLHPFATSPPSSTQNLYDDDYRVESPTESIDNLPPIAARFMSPVSFRPETPTSPTGRSEKDTPNIDGESLDTDEEDEGDDQIGRGYPSRSGNASQASKHNHPRSPYRATVTRTAGKSAPVPFPSRSHQSLPPPARTNQMSSSTHSLGRQSTVETARERNLSQGQSSMKTSGTQGRGGMLKKFKKNQARSESILGSAVAPHQLPADLRICLEVIDSGVLEGHCRLSEALRKRYEEQYPLVRSLADVFVANSDIFHGYATYVLHLERALEQVEDAISRHNKKPKKQDATEWAKVVNYLTKIEENAIIEKGETGLAITLSKPFQRLLKYPLLFQNLLFHTDPSTFEYESTLQMVAEVESIVRSIEDEKIQKEERDKTRDVFARIEGLDKVKQLALPKPSRFLVEERPFISGASPSPLSGPPKGTLSPPPTSSKGVVKGKSSFKRLSDVLNSGTGVGGKKDLWFVVFNDVVLLCQRTGTTSLPLVSATTSRTNSLPELQGKAKYATTGRRNSQTKPRNLYKFLKIETWSIGDVARPREGVVSMEDVVRSRNHVHSSNQPRIIPLPDDDEDGGADSDDSDRKSKMSFSYWGADKVTVQKPTVRPRAGASGNSRRPGLSSAYARESSANAKFGTRLVGPDHPIPSTRTASRRTQTPTSRKPHYSEENQSVKATVTRPAWDMSTRSQFAGTPAPSKRSRNTSQTSAATPSTRVPVAPKVLSSPAPSEDSGVGFYRQIMQDPSLNQA